MTPEPTTRAYTIRLDELGDPIWRDHVWNTHVTVNRGVWTWGDWLLSLRGALPASLANEHPERKVILALSWLSVESPRSLAPEDEKKIVAYGDGDPKDRVEKVMQRFQEILKAKKATHKDEWLAACEPALSARIRPDAVWVDRSTCFRDLQQEFGNKFTVDWATTTFLDLIGGEKDYFAMPAIDGAASSEAKDFVIKAGNWLSRNWGSGKKSEAGAIVESLESVVALPKRSLVGKSGSNVVAKLLESLGQESEETDPEKLLKELKQVVGWKGRSSKGAEALKKLVAAETVDATLWDAVCGKLQDDIASQSTKLKTAGKAPSWMPKMREQLEARIGMPFRTSKDHIWEYAVMLDHALRRLSSAHSWIKRAEVQRSKFKENAGKIESLPKPVIELLDTYCQDRSATSGALNEYLIRKRALEGWDKVVAKWETKKCETVEHRIQAVRDIQGEIEKFGDAQLFEALAADEYLPVWRGAKNKGVPETLRNYADARTAQHDQRRFKVPAYRHPDPLRNPVWADFGNSRWGISYSALAAVRGRRKLLEKAKVAKTEAAKQKIADELATEKSLKEVSLGLWCGEGIAPVSLQWRSKRLSSNLALKSVFEQGPSVSRADRLGRAVAGSNGEAVTVAEVFNQNDWSGRLQAKRADLDRLADFVYGKKEGPRYEVFDGALQSSALQRWGRLRWFLSYSAKLLPNGPLFDYVKSPEFETSGWKYVKGRNGYYFQHSANEGRKGRTRSILSRLPGLRILSFDLGHRYAAACTVWLTLTEKQLKKEIAGREIVGGGTAARDLYVHTLHTAEAGKTRKTIYRRTGSDMWARLDRQFVIKLQGEDHSARRATEQEVEQFEEHLMALGRNNSRDLVHYKATDDPIVDSDKSRRRKHVDELLRVATDELKRALRRHGDVARIANAFQSNVKQLAGGRTYNFFESNPGMDGDSPEKRAENYQQFLLDALVVWHELNGGNWQHTAALDLWEKHILPLLESGTIETPAADESSVERKSRIKRVEESLRPIALQLANNEALRERLATEFTELWKQEDAAWRGKGGHLRWLRQLILPRIGPRPASDSSEFKAWKERARSLRHVGGLSIERLATITKLYQIQRAFYSRPEPANLRAGIERIEKGAEEGHRFGQRIIEALEYLRQNRIKQLASRLVEAALGVGSENRQKHWEGKRHTKRPRRQVFDPCHVIVGENLENYRPEQTRLRSENKRLRDWAARNVRKLIMEGCQLHGLHFVEVDPRYTSRQDSRTGAPGVRCTDISIKKFLARKDVAKACERVEKKGQDTRDLMIATLFARYSNSSDDAVIRITQGGGELFVSSHSGVAIQADLNAAANIGLKALVDPDWTGAWWYIPVKQQDGVTDPKDFPSCSLFEKPLQLLEAKSKNEDEAVTTKRDKINAWRDLASDSFKQGKWLEYGPYWGWVEKKVLLRLADSQKLVLKETGH
jgi:IS605 OrfB family transposase